MSDAQPSPNAALLGQPGSRQRLQTPALVLDLDALEANLATMAAWAEGNGLALRPHAKSHKSPDIARRQLAAGAAGVCCASLREAEVMAAAGIPGLLITTALAPDKAARVAALAAGGADLACTVDHPELLAAYGAAAEAAGTRLKVVVDLDVGLGRTGTPSADDAVTLARQAAAHDSLAYCGVQAYMGHLQHIAQVADRDELLAEPTDKVEAMVEALREANLAPGTVTGGGTGTHRLDAARGALNEMQCGSYVFMDVDYDAVAQPDGARPYTNALFVQTSVVNVNHPGYAVTDAGLKSFATDGPLPVIARGAPDGASYRYMGDEHGAVVFAGQDERLALGDRVECVVPHCDPNVNLFDHYHVIRGDALVEIWPVAARGNP